MKVPVLQFWHWNPTASSRRYIPSAHSPCSQLSPKKGVVKAFKTKLTDLDSVDNDRLEYCRQLARCKGVFRQVDRDNSGDIERNELYGGLRRYKVPITRDEFKHIFRVIDPDQVSRHLRPNALAPLRRCKA